ncbi:MarR family winged helix-turn-helix transcriptional regulator [Conexibacter sp. W3-3-2]|uniref:MarR family winged helix-turn-helix transcriptional regulator n=1 Tax=Conexibacter sp. W3-3-2 TaxID=2675227 RepID=UPI0012B93289|nr:MarR family winged helix-turn-helix transcriptional regulator [Conexibacter sp. W3-3-2]
MAVGEYRGPITELPVVNQAPPRSAVFVVHLARLMRLRSEAALEPLGLRSRHLIALTVLRDSPGIAQQDLAGAIQIDRTNLVGLLNELEEHGWVLRRRSAEDRRRHVVELTEAGQHLLARAEFALAAVEDEVLADLTTKERATLHRLLQRATARATVESSCTEEGSGADR